VGAFFTFHAIYISALEETQEKDERERNKTAEKGREDEFFPNRLTCFEDEMTVK